MASQCVPLALCGSVFAIKVAHRETESVVSRRSHGYTLRKVGTSFEAHSVCTVSIINNHSAELIYPNIIVVIQVQQKVDRLWNWLRKLNLDPYDRCCRWKYGPVRRHGRVSDGRVS